MIIYVIHYYLYYYLLLECKDKAQFNFILNYNYHNAMQKEDIPQFFK